MRQRAGGVEGEMHCAYRGVNNTSCAVGCLIPPDFYNPQIEGKDASQIIHDFPTVAKGSGFSKRNEKLLTELQCIHDFINSADWKSELQSLARKFRLKFPRI